MLMVIFGAGASYDSAPSIPIRPEDITRPPLANRLFDTRLSFKSAMKEFEQCLPIIPYLQRQNVEVERVLEGLREETRDYPVRHQQLAAIRYYLHYALRDLELRWLEAAKGVTNYKTLLDQIQRWRKPGEQVCLATFNYDTLLEDALPTVHITINDLNDYIASEDYKVIKLHGSINWAREIHKVPFGMNGLNDWQIARGLIQHAAGLDISDSYRRVTTYPMGKADGTALFPALAIPVETKGTFECPEPHLDALRQCIRKVSKLLIIGWRGVEEHLLRLLVEHLPSRISVLAVNGDRHSGDQAILNLSKAGVRIGSANAIGIGFSDFIVQRTGDDFLRA